MAFSSVSADIFRAYDIRGVVDDPSKGLTEATVRLIGKAIGTVALSQAQTDIVIGRDGRLSGERLSHALCQGLLSTGIGVIDIGMVPTPLVYMGAHAACASGVMLTGSHNPPNYNGLKIVIAGQTLSGEGILDLYARICQGQFAIGQGQYETKNIIPDYTQAILNNIQKLNLKLNLKLKVVIDCGNGIAGKLAPALVEQLNCEVIPLFCEVDGNFPNHHPDPSRPENLQALIQAVRHHKADIGLAFDGDGDRLGVVTNQGEIIWPDRVLMLYAQAILAKQPGAEIIYDVKCSSHLSDVIQKAGGIATMSQTGHSFMKAKMKSSGALLGGEMSGHFFFQDRWYGFDDAIYAACRLLEILAESPVSASEVFAQLPNAISTPEINIALPDAQKFIFIEQLKKALLLNRADTDAKLDINFKPIQMITIDGLRIEWPTGWGLVRASNTTPNLVLRFEAVTEAALFTIQSFFKQAMEKIEPSLRFDF